MLPKTALKSIPVVDAPNVGREGEFLSLPMEINIDGFSYKLNVPEFFSSVVIPEDARVLVPESLALSSGLSYELDTSKNEVTSQLPAVMSEANVFDLDVVEMNDENDEERYQKIIKDLADDFIGFLMTKSSKFTDVVAQVEPLTPGVLVQLKYEVLDEQDRKFLSGRLLELLYRAPEFARPNLVSIAEVIKRSLVFTEQLSDSIVVDLLVLRLYMLLINRLHPSRILFDEMFGGFSKKLSYIFDDMLSIRVVVVEETGQRKEITNAEEALQFVKEAFFIKDHGTELSLTTNYGMTFESAKVKVLSTGEVLEITRPVTIEGLKTLPCKITKTASKGSIVIPTVPDDAVFTSLLSSGAKATYFQVGRFYSDRGDEFLNLNVRIVKGFYSLGLQTSSPTLFAKIVLNDKYDMEEDIIIKRPYNPITYTEAKETLNELLMINDNSYKRAMAILHRTSHVLEETTFLTLLELHKIFPPTYREVAYTYLTKISNGREIITPIGYLSSGVLLQTLLLNGGKFSVPTVDTYISPVQSHKNLIKSIAMSSKLEDFAREFLANLGRSYKAFSPDIKIDLDLTELKVSYKSDFSTVSIILRGSDNSAFGFVKVSSNAVKSVPVYLPVYIYTTESTPLSNIWIKDVDEWISLVDGDSGVLLSTFEIPISRINEQINLGDSYEAIKLMTNNDIDYIKNKNTIYVQNGKFLVSPLTGNFLQIVNDTSLEVEDA